MCLILLAYRAHPDAELILAGNRDEFYARPSAPPALIATRPRIWAGRDLEAGGTWMGRNEHGLTAALTNRRSADMAARERSRGEVVAGILAQPDAQAAADWVAGLDVERYRPFSVLFGTTERYFYAASAEGGRPRELAPGFHVLSNSALDDASWPKVARSQDFLRRARGLDGEALLRALQAFLCDPTPPDHLPEEDPDREVHGPLGAVFIRTVGYGTVSSSILTAGGRLGERYYYAEAADMGDAQEGWARGATGGGNPHNGVYVPPSAEGSPYRLLHFAE